MSSIPDPFRTARQEKGVLACPFHGEKIVMLLRHDDVRKAAKDWQTFSSDVPFRVPIPSEENVRTMRQLPIETNPPEHTEYRKITEPFFQRPKDPAFIARVDAESGEVALHRDGSVERVPVDWSDVPACTSGPSPGTSTMLRLKRSLAKMWVLFGSAS